MDIPNLTAESYPLYFFQIDLLTLLGRGTLDSPGDYERSPFGGSESSSRLIDPPKRLSDNVLSVFIDESGNFGYTSDSSPYYILTLVFHDQRQDLSEKFESLKSFPFFHAGPLIRCKEEWENVDLPTRKKVFHRFFLTVASLPISCKTFSHVKKGPLGSPVKLERKMSLDLQTFLAKEAASFARYEKVNIYYDKGQIQISRILRMAFPAQGINAIMKPAVKQENYRLAQAADLLGEIALARLKLENNDLNPHDVAFFYPIKELKRLYIRYLERIEIR